MTEKTWSQIIELKIDEVWMKSFVKLLYIVVVFLVVYVLWTVNLILEINL